MRSFTNVSSLPASAPTHDTFRARPIPAKAGIGLRTLHHLQIIEHGTSAAWLEVHPENYIDQGVCSWQLEKIRQNHPLSIHSVGLSLGSADGLDEAHLSTLCTFIKHFKPALVSDHLSWSQCAGIHVPELMPLPYTDEAFQVVSRNIYRCQDHLQTQVLIENPASYLNFSASRESEPQFLADLVRRTGCGVLLDINNLYISAQNKGWSPLEVLALYLALIPNEAIGEIHLAGHTIHTTQSGTDAYIDDHGTPVISHIWELFEHAVSKLGPRPTLIEWDTNIPPLEFLEIEAATAQYILDHRKSSCFDHVTVSRSTEKNAQ
jgi:uncharacterized protein